MTRITRRRLLKGSGTGLAALTAGCTGGPGAGTETSTDTTTGGANKNEVHFLTDYSNDAWQDKWENEIVPGFEEQTGIPVNVEYAGMQGTGEQRLTTLMQSGDTPESFTGTLTQVGDMVARGQTAPVGDALSAIEEENGDLLYKSTVTVSDQVHMIPHGLYLGGTFNYRKDVYEKLGLEVPETWEELVHNAKVIDESDEVQERGFAMPAPKAGKSGSEFSNFLANAGGGTWQWETEGETAKVWFEEEHVLAALDAMSELAEYSPDPSSVNWSSTIKYWVGGRVAQTIMNNAWLAGPAYGAGVTDIALNTDVAPIPKREGADPIDRGWALLDGHPVLSDADNVEGAKELLKFMYEGPETQADKSTIEPMRFLPPYESAVDTDEYQSAEIFGVEDGYFLDLNRKCMEEVAPNLQSPDRPSTPATLFAGRFPIDSEMVNQVLVQERDPAKAYEEAKSRLQKRLEEGQELTA